MKKKKFFIGTILFTLILIAFGVRLFLIQSHSHITADGPAYVAVGKKIISGEKYFDAVWSPFYPVLIGITSLIFRDFEFAGRLVSVLFGSLLIIPLFFIAKWAFNEKVGIIASILIVLYPNLSKISSQVAPESTFIFLFLIGLIVSWLAISKEKNVFFLLSGLIWGICYLTRPEGFGYLVLLLIIGLIQFFKGQKRRWTVHISLIIIGFLIVSSPYILYLKRDTGRWSLSKKAEITILLGEGVGKREDWGHFYEKFSHGLSENAKEIGYQRGAQYKGMIGYSLHNRRELIRRYLVNLHLVNKYVIPGLFPPIIILLAGLGLFRGVLQETKKSLLLFLAFIPYFSLPFLVVPPRYFLLFVPLILIWAGKGVVEINKWFMELLLTFREKWKKIRIKPVILESILIFLVLLSFVPFTFRPFLKGEIEPNFYKDIGLWIRDNLPQNAVIMSRKPWIPFYAQREEVPLPYAPFPEIIKFAHYQGANYLIADENVIGDRPNLRFLFDEDYKSGKIKIIHRFKNKAGRKIYLYKIKD